MPIRITSGLALHARATAFRFIRPARQGGQDATMPGLIP